MALIGTILSGNEFNEIYGNIKFVKLLNDNMVHCHKDQKSGRILSFEYNFGLNIDVRPVDHLGKGMSFCAQSKIDLFRNRYGKYYAYISIPNDAHVYVGADRFKTDMLIFTDIYKLSDNSLKCRKNKHILKHSEDQTEEQCITAVQRDGMELSRVKNQTEKICMAAVQQNYQALCYVRNQTDEICIAAIRQNYRALQYVHNQTDEMCKIATRQNYAALCHVKKELRTEEICKYVVAQCGSMLDYVPNQTEELCIIAVRQYGLALKCVKIQTEKICKQAVQNNGFSLKYVNDEFKTKEICMLAVMNRRSALQFVNKENLQFVNEENLQSYKMDIKQQNDIKQKYLYDSLNQLDNLEEQFLENKTKDMCKITLQKDGLALGFIKKHMDVLDDELYKIAVKQNCLAFGLVPKQFRTQEIHDLAFGDQAACSHENPLNADVNKVLRNTDTNICHLVMLFDYCKQEYLKKQENKSTQ